MFNLSLTAQDKHKPEKQARIQNSLAAGPQQSKKSKILDLCSTVAKGVIFFLLQ